MHTLREVYIQRNGHIGTYRHVKVDRHRGKQQNRKAKNQIDRGRHRYRKAYRYTEGPTGTDTQRRTQADRNKQTGIQKGSGSDR